MRAEPKNTGESSPFVTSSMSKSALAPSNSSISSMSWLLNSSPISSERAGSSIWMIFSEPSFVPFKVSAKVMTSLLFLSYTPLNCFPEPIGQLIGHVAIPSSFSMSSRSSNVSLASRSILFMNVKIGICLMTQTLKSFLVCASTPLLASITMTAESAAMSVRYVSSEKSWCPGVSRILMQYPS